MANNYYSLSWRGVVTLPRQVETITLKKNYANVTGAAYFRSVVSLVLILTLVVIGSRISMSNEVFRTNSIGRDSGLPLPRFVSLRSGEVNMRTGPGVQYPVEWIYAHRSYPVEIIAEFDTWRRIRDWEGNEGWVHQTMLTRRRTFIVSGRQRFLLARPDDDAPIVVKLGHGVVGDLLQCPTNIAQYCRVEVQNYIGWLRRSDFWGIQLDEFL